MRITKNKTIKCSARIMARLLEIMDDCVGSGKYRHLITEAGVQPQLGGDMFMFRSGAKLSRLSASEWFIYGYASNNSDGRAAFFQLKAAEHLRLAMDLMSAVDDVMHTAPSARLTYRGLWGTRTAGSRSPNELNYPSDSHTKFYQATPGDNGVAHD